MSELTGLEWTMRLQSSAQELWRKQRRGFHKSLGPTSVPQWADVQEGSAASLLTLLKDPSMLSEYAKFAIGSMAMRVAYGISPEDDRLDEALLLVHEGVQIFTFPGAGFRKEAARWRRTYERVWGKAFDDFVARMRKIEVGALGQAPSAWQPMYSLLPQILVRQGSPWQRAPLLWRFTALDDLSQTTDAHSVFQYPEVHLFRTRLPPVSDGGTIMTMTLEWTFIEYSVV